MVTTRKGTKPRLQVDYDTEDEPGRRTGTASKAAGPERGGFRVLRLPPWRVNLGGPGTCWKQVGPRKGLGFDCSALRHPTLYLPVTFRGVLCELTVVRTNRAPLCTTRRKSAQSTIPALIGRWSEW